MKKKNDFNNLNLKKTQNTLKKNNQYLFSVIKLFYSLNFYMVIKPEFIITDYRSIMKTDKRYMTIYNMEMYGFPLFSLI
jgi:hypothetical protein